MSAGKGDGPRHDIRAWDAGFGGIRWQGDSSGSSSPDFTAHVVFFDQSADGRWRKMAEMLRFSMALQGHECVLHELEGPSFGTGCKARNNVVKLEKWVEIVGAASGPVLLMDADMVCLKSLDGAFDAVEHVGITWRSPEFPSASPLNAGLVFARPTEWALDFFSRWRDADERIMRDKKWAKPYRAKWAGQNQAALGSMIELGTAEKLTRLECQELNLCEPWARLADARVVHIKARLLAMIWNKLPARTIDERRALRAWQNMYERFLESENNNGDV